jgi:hypothetical protein
MSIAIMYGLTHVIAKKKLHNWIKDNKSISVKDTRLNLLMGNLSLLQADIYNASYTTDTCTISSLKIIGFSLFDFLSKNEISIDRLILDQANLYLTDPPNTKSKKDEKSIIDIEKVDLNNSTVIFQSEKFSLEASIGSANLSELSKRNKLTFKDINLQGHSIKYKPYSGPHWFILDTLNLSTITDEFAASTFKIQPICTKEEWNTCFPNKKSRSSYTAKNIVGNLDTNSITDGIFLSELNILEGSFTVLTYQEQETEPSPRTFFMEQFNKIDIPINIPKIKVRNHTIEALLKEENIDTISFDDVYATFSNVTNIPELLTIDDNIRVTTLSKFMDTKLSVNFNLKVDDPVNSYSFDLSLDPMPFTNLNKALRYNTPLAVEEGELQKLGCRIKGNDKLSTGECDMAYKNLYVTIENQKGVTKKLFTKVLNFIVKDGTSKNNSAISKSYSSTLERDTNKDFFYHAYTIILQIIREAMLPI